MVYEVPDKILQTSRYTLQIQKSPPGFHLTGFQDFISGSGDHRQRILVGWRSLNLACNLLFNS